MLGDWEGGAFISTITLLLRMLIRSMRRFAQLFKPVVQ